MLTRRKILERSAQLGVAYGLSGLPPKPGKLAKQGVEANDAQSRLNRTVVQRIAQPTTIHEIIAQLRDARRSGLAVSLAGGRHAMGGQQFGADTLLLDMKKFNKVVRFNRDGGTIEVESGIEWPELIGYLHRQQAGRDETWSIRQKQTGVDRVSIGGSLSANIHGRGLMYPPFISDVESFVLLDANGKLHQCSRNENAELFSLVVGGYGLWGIIIHATLRLVPRRKVERVVEVIPVKDLISRVDDRIKQGFEFGDCQYATDLTGKAALHPGVFSCYRAVAPDREISAGKTGLAPKDWARLYALARKDKKTAFATYSNYYLGTSGKVYWSDTHQLSSAFDGYRDAVNPEQGTEMITEVYVSRDAFIPFMSEVREDFVKHHVDLTYGTIRFIEKDEESFLAWADKPYVCIVCNLHVRHTERGKRKAVEDFRRIINRVIQHNGRYYLTYHRWATRQQVETCHPKLVEFLRLKKKYDPQERFQSEWYRHYKRMFADKI